MLFSQRKISSEQAQKMRECALESVRAYVPLPAPAYVFLSSNAKFVAVKAPLDFFTSAQLEKFKPLGKIYYPEFIEKVEPFLSTAHQLERIFSEPAPDGELAAAPYEISDMFLRVAGGLWSDGGVVEPFFVAILAHELCGPLEGTQLEDVYSRSVENYEQSILRSGWAVWQGLHLGYYNQAWLRRLRDGVFRVASGQLLGREAIRRILPEDWMIEAAENPIALNGQTLERAAAVTERLKLWSRGERLRTELIVVRDGFTSIFGPGGFRDG